MAQSKIGKYDVLRSLRQDPAGDVHLAEDRGDGRRVVIQMLSADEKLVEQARKVAALSHPAVGTAQVGLHGSTPFLVTDYIAGSTLGEWVAGEPSLGDRLRIAAALADALTHVHEQGVVHGALDPSAVRISDDGELHLVDFEVGLPRHAQSPGGVAYRAPEVLQGEAYTQKSEIYTAALLCYEALAGKNPFARGTATATREAALNDQPTPLAETRRDVPRELSDAIMACLEKDPEWRPKDLSYVLEVAQKAASQTRPSARPAAKAPRKAAPAPAPARASVEPQPLPSFGGKPRQNGSRAPLIGLTTALLVAAGVGGWRWLRPAAAPTRTAQAGLAPTTTAETTAAETSNVPAAPMPKEAGTAAPVFAEAAKPTPKPQAEVSAATPLPTVPATPVPVATPVAATPPPVTEPPRPSLEPERPSPTPAVDVTTMAPVAPAALTTVTPPSLKRPARTVLDVRGTGLRADHRAIVFKGKDMAKGINVLGQKLVSPSLIQVMVQVDADASPGIYTIALGDPHGEVTNGLRLEVVK